MIELETRPPASLVVPDGWVIDRLAADRLAHRLATAPSDVTAVIAPTNPLSPGASFRTHAERCLVEPPGQPLVTDEAVRGVALVRPEVGFMVDAGVVAVADGRVLVDPACHSHDPSTALSEIEPASTRGRSPFARRPLVLFLGLEPDLGRAVWARRLVNDLLGHEIEARLATAATPDGPHLTRPCLPVAESIRALRPDVVITLDDSAEDQISSWCDRRSTVVVHHTGERTLTTELVPWRIGAAMGRVRALIGGAVEPAALSNLCRRLCSGPLPAPPSVDESEPRPISPPRAKQRSVRRRSVAVVRSSNEAGHSERLDTFLAHAAALGASTTLIDIADAPSVVDHDVVVLSSDVDPALGARLVESRSTAGRRTLVDVVSAHDVADLAHASKAATAPTEAVRAALEHEGIAVRLLPELLPRADLRRLRHARVDRVSDSPLVVGVGVDDDQPRTVAALADAIGQLLAESSTIQVEWAGSDAGLPARLLGDPRVETVGPHPIDHHRAHWAAHAWIGSKSTSDEVGRPDALTVSSYLGIPTVFDASTRGDIADDLICRWALDDATNSTQWLDRLRTVVGEPDVWRDALHGRADLLFGPSAARSTVNRLLGWAGVRRTD